MSMGSDRWLNAKPQTYKPGLRNIPETKLSGLYHPVCYALIGGEQGFGLGPCQTGNHNLFADVERAQVLFARLGADLCHGFPPQEGTTHSGGKFLKRGY